VSWLTKYHSEIES